MLRFTPELLNKRHWSGPGLLAFLTAFLTGCANTCFVAVSNPPLTITSPAPESQDNTRSGATFVACGAGDGPNGTGGLSLS